MKTWTARTRTQDGPSHGHGLIRGQPSPASRNSQYQVLRSVLYGSSIQYAPLMGAQSDSLEQEADRAADRIIDDKASQGCGCGGAPGPTGGCSRCAQAGLSLQRKGSGAGAPQSVPSSVREVLRAPGNELEPQVRDFMEAGFGADLGHVRVHTDARAAASARALGARAYTVGRDIVFADGEFAPGSSKGMHLIAHELAHTIQQGSASQGLQRQTGNAPAPVARQPRPINVRWRGSVRGSLFSLLRSAVSSDEEAARITERIMRQATRYVSMRKAVSLEEFERIGNEQQRQFFTLDPSLVQIIQQETGWSQGEFHERIERSAEHARVVEAFEQLFTLQPTGSVPASEEARQTGPVAPTQANWAILRDNPELSRLYLQHMEHFGGLALTPPVQQAASDGLTPEELVGIVGPSKRLLHLTNLFTQGFTEFSATGGSDLARFGILMERILEQFVWGNPTATHNQLRIGMGWPEEGRQGIAHRASGILLYDENAQPLPSFAGTRFRDEGYTATTPPSEFGINIALITDPVLRGILNSMRQQVGDPTRMVAHGAGAYFQNIELVNAKVREGLTEEILQKFEDALPAFVGFLAGHGLATFLMRVPNPVVAGIGLALKGLLTAAGYVMSIDFAGSAMQRLLKAASHLSRVEPAPQGGRPTSLSLYHLEEAARPIRSMVADIAMTAATIGLTRLLGAIRGRGTATIECTRCRIRRQHARESRRHHEGQQLGFTRAQIRSMRGEITQRPRVRQIEGHRHRGAEGHGVPDEVILRTVNNPQKIFVARNGNWVFFRNGTIVVTPRGNPSFINTAYGRGAHVPQRRVADIRALHNDPTIRAGDPEPAVVLAEWVGQQFGDFAVFSIWP
jgi:hypothetical protein